MGLKWRNQMKDDGTEEWVFESLNEEMESNKVDLSAFWLGVVGAPLVWGLLLLANILTLNVSSSILMGMCFGLSAINCYA